jgi:hypothetical protein
MHQHPRLAGARPGQHQRVGVFPVVGDDGALVGLGQRFDDASQDCGVVCRSSSSSRPGSQRLQKTSRDRLK